MRGGNLRNVRAGQQRSGYLPSLDGWRAVAIVGVLLAHDQTWRIGRFSDARWKAYGGWGVWLFFAISGVLICTRILEEEATLGRFRLRAFYVRRVFRIQPAALAYLAVVAVLIATGIVHERWHFWWGALLLYENFLYHQQNWTLIMAGYFTGHFWTLALEEQFYFVLSLFLWTVRRHRVVLLTGLLVLLFAGQHVAKVHGLFSEDVSARRPYWNMQYLLFPALLALLLREGRVMEVTRRYLKPGVAYGGTLGLLAVHHLVKTGSVRVWHLTALVEEGKLLLLLTGFWIIATMLHPKSWSTRVLELGPLRYLGRLSYSIYLWHLLFFCTIEPDTHVTWAPLVVLGQRPLRYLCVLGLAMLSYQLIEKPLIRLGHRLAPPTTPGHADLAATPLPEGAAMPVPVLLPVRREEGL